MENMSASSEKVAVPVSTAAVQPRPVIAGAVPIRPTGPVLIRAGNLAPGAQPRPVVLIRPSPRPPGGSGSGGVLTPQSRTVLTRPHACIISFSSSQGSAKVAPPVKTELSSPHPQPLTAKPSTSSPNLTSTSELVTSQTPVAALLRNAPISMKLEPSAPASSIASGSNSTVSRPVIHRLLAGDLKTISAAVQPKTTASLQQQQQQPNRKVTREMQVRVCKRRDRRFSVLRYNAYDRLDLSGGLSSSEASSSKGSGNQEVFLRRENNLRQFKAANNILDLPTRGAGSEFGQEAKEEARLRRMGVSRQGYRAEDQPWLLTVGKGSAAKRYRGVREGNVSANVRYFIFCQTKDGNFDAYPVHEWYKLNPEVSYRYLRDEEAEAEYNRRHKTMNLFNVMVKRKLVDDTTEEGLTEAKEASARIKAGLAATATDAAAKAEAKGTNGGGGAGGSKRSRSFLLTELDEWNELSDEDEEDEDEEEGGKAGAEAATAADGDDSGLLGADSDGEGGGRAGGARGGKKSKTAAARRKQRAAAIVARKRRGTKQRQRRRKNTTLADSSDEEDDANEEAWDESEPDDHEGDEVDYITDSSSDEEKLSADEREQIYQETGVDEEQGLKALLTDISDSDENPDELKPNDVHAGDEGGEGAGDRDGSDAEAGGRKHSSKSGREGEGGNGSRGGKHKRHRHHHHRNGSRVDENESSSGSSDDDDDDENASSSSSSSTSSSDSSSTSSDSDFDMAPDDPERLARMAQKKAEMMRKISDKVSASSASTAVTGSPSSKDSAANPPTTVMPKRPAETGATEEMTEGGAVKRLKMADNAATPATVAATAAPPPPPPDDELTAHVRKYLMRKPITVTELLKKIRIKKLVPKTDDAQTLLANALRRLRPIKQIINGQHVLSLKR